MPSYNLVESVHNKWLQASKNKGGDLYIAVVDDYIHTFLQVVAYYEFLKGGTGGIGPSKEELKLRFSQRRVEQTRDLDVLQKALLDMLDSTLEILTSKGQRYLDHKSTSPTHPLEPTTRCTPPTLSTSYAHVLIRESQDLKQQCFPPLLRKLPVHARLCPTISY